MISIKRVIAFVLCLIFLLSTSLVMAETEDVITDLDIMVVDGSKIKITGNYAKDRGYTFGNYISVIVLNSEHENYPQNGNLKPSDYTSVGTSGILKYVGAILADNSGNISTMFDFSGTSGNYEFVFTDYSGDVQRVIEFIEISLCTLFNNAKVDSDGAIIDFLSNFLDSSYFDIQSYNALGDTGKQEIMAQIKAIDIDDNGHDSDLQTKLSSLKVFEKLLTESTVDKAGELQKCLVDGIAAGYERYNENSCKLYTDKLTKEEQVEIIGSYAGQTLPDDFYKTTFYDTCFMKHISGAKYYAQIQEIVETDYALLEIPDDTMASYNNVEAKSEVAISLLASIENGSITTPVSFRQKLSSLIATQLQNETTPPAPSRPSPGGGGGGGGGISSGASGVTIGKVDKTENNTEEKTDVEVEPSQEKLTNGEEVFKDLGDFDWAKEAIYKLYEDKIISGVTKDTFCPDKMITRAEFSKLLASGLRLTGAEGDENFEDVSESDWYYSSVVALNRAGIVSGISDTEFSPDANITREDIAVMIVRAVRFKAFTLKEDSETEFSDDNMISAYASSSVKTLSKAGIINGSDGAFLPKNNASRAEAAQMLYKFFSQTGIVK